MFHSMDRLLPQNPSTMITMKKSTLTAGCRLIYQPNSSFPNDVVYNRGACGEPCLALVVGSLVPFLLGQFVVLPLAYWPWHC
jgi:hypothetical protein